MVPLLSQFYKKIEDLRIETSEQRYYVQVRSLEQWLADPDGSTTGRSRAEQLFHDVYRTEHFSPSFDPSILRGSKSALLIFSILLRLDHGHLLKAFTTHDYFDSRLPIDVFPLRRHLENLERNRYRLTMSPSELANRFNKLQYEFCPMIFGSRLEKSLRQEHVIPICCRKSISDKGGTAVPYSILVQEEFVDQDLQTLAAESRVVHPDLGVCYQFVLKAFYASMINRWNTEATAYDLLGHQNRLLRYFGRFQQPVRAMDDGDQLPSPGQQNPLTTKSYILLEWAQGDLDKHFETHQPPVLPREIALFWTSLSEIFSTVANMHEFDAPSGVKFTGTHGDIKPDNIISINGLFKLADPGFAQFHREDAPDPNASCWGGTTTFGAPETLHQQGERWVARPPIDIWSLGCVFSIAATWIVLGYDGIIQYAKLRERAVTQIFQASGRSTERDDAVGDWFHDGKDTLQAVTDWHNYLRLVLRNSDTFTAGILDIIDKFMLKGEQTRRWKAKQLHQKLSAALQQADSTVVPVALPASLKEHLAKINEEANYLSISDLSASATQARVSASEERYRHKSVYSRLPHSKVTHRSQSLRNAPATGFVASDRFDGSGQLSRTLRPRNTTSENLPEAIIPSVSTRGPTRIEAATYLPLFRSGTPGSIAPSFTTTSTTKLIPQNIFEAHYSSGTNFLRRNTRDKRLKEFFNNRDIQFLVDNAGTMKEHWAAVKFTVEQILKNCHDDDGMEFDFTNGRKHMDTYKSTKAIISLLSQEAVTPKMEWTTDMEASLASFTERCRLRLINKHGEPIWDIKPLTLIVLTDGIWQGMRNDRGVDELIIKFAKVLAEWTTRRARSGRAKKPLERPFSIQFVYYGHDPKAALRLRRLDDDLKPMGIDDIIDCTHFLGDVNKMILGSFMPDYDETEDENELSSPSSLYTEGSFSHRQDESRKPIMYGHSALQESPRESSEAMNISGYSNVTPRSTPHNRDTSQSHQSKFYSYPQVQPDSEKDDPHAFPPDPSLTWSSQRNSLFDKFHLALRKG